MAVQLLPPSGKLDWGAACYFFLQIIYSSLLTSSASFTKCHRLCCTMCTFSVCSLRDKRHIPSLTRWTRIRHLSRQSTLDACRYIPIDDQSYRPCSCTHITDEDEQNKKKKWNNIFRVNQSGKYIDTNLESILIDVSCTAAILEIASRFLP